VEIECLRWKREFEDLHLLVPDEERHDRLMLMIWFSAPIIALGVYKWWVAYEHHHPNVGGLIALGIVALIVMGCLWCHGPLTFAGKCYLGKVVDRVNETRWLREFQPGTHELLLSVAALGLVALEQTPGFGTLYDFFEAERSNACECGAPGSCDGGCGGGCGGCGGCGG
jgi:uncharacterized protein (TIGR04222 family)